MTFRARNHTNDYFINDDSFDFLKEPSGEWSLRKLAIGSRNFYRYDLTFSSFVDLRKLDKIQGVYPT